jgi:hypothetical protein
MKRAPSKVSYKVEAFDPPAIYPLSSPVPVTVTPLSPDLVYELPSSIFRIECNANEDFDLRLKLTRLQADGSEVAVDITGWALTLVIRPRFDHATVIKRLDVVTTGNGIIVEDAAAGMIRIYLAQPVVASDLLVSKSPADHWDYFLNGTVTGTITELFRGPLVVHAGRYP